MRQEGRDKGSRAWEYRYRHAPCEFTIELIDGCSVSPNHIFYCPDAAFCGGARLFISSSSMMPLWM